MWNGNWSKTIFWFFSLPPPQKNSVPRSSFSPTPATHWNSSKRAWRMKMQYLSIMILQLVIYTSSIRKPVVNYTKLSSYFSQSSVPACSSCFDTLCCLSLSFCVDWYSHWLHKCITVHVLILCVALDYHAMMLDTYTGHINTWQLQV